MTHPFDVKSVRRQHGDVKTTEMKWNEKTNTGILCVIVVWCCLLIFNDKPGQPFGNWRNSIELLVMRRERKKQRKFFQRNQMKNKLFGDFYTKLNNFSLLNVSHSLNSLARCVCWRFCGVRGRCQFQFHHTILRWNAPLLLCAGALTTEMINFFISLNLMSKFPFWRGESSFSFQFFGVFLKEQFHVQSAGKGCCVDHGWRCGVILREYKSPR